ncbi:5'-nucleotidase [Flavobacteriaceae bacterium S356]|uniref:5'-nucleotidase n=1 Tax=Asprobacillus argus TaxID=3076534 RepID=A0ABU3LH28_9FLAO|nr:5'-nucleotidase [Flavobacteriaceae bacterium S356]
MKKILFSFLLVSFFLSCKDVAYKNTKIVGKTSQIDSTTVADSTYIKVIEPYKEKMIKEINTVLTYTPIDLVRTDGNRQSTLGNLLADLAYTRANPLFKKETGKDIDFALFNYGGIRSGIFTGDVTNRNAFQLMPFENMLVVVELSAEKVQELVNYFTNGNRAHPLSKQVQLTIRQNGHTLKIHGKPFDKSKTYYVLTSDYLQSGGDRMDFFKDPVKLYKLDYKVRDAIIDYFKSVDTLTSTLDNRVILK